VVRAAHILRAAVRRLSHQVPTSRVVKTRIASKRLNACCKKMRRYQ